MRLIMIYYAYVKTTTYRREVGRTGTGRGSRIPRPGRNARSAINTSSRTDGCDAEANRHCPRGGTSHRPPVANALPERDLRIVATSPWLGWTAPFADERAGGEGIPPAVAGTGGSRRDCGDVTTACRLGATAWAPCCRVSGLSATEPPRMEESCTRHTSSQKRPGRPGGVEKKLPETLASILKTDEVKGRQIRLMFQDEARFGRMVRIRRCWAPAPLRPKVANGYERQYVYVYGAVSPVAGELDWKICQEMNTDRMREFLQQVSTTHINDFIVMVVDGASSHKAKALTIPENIRLLRLPGYSPELNPQEHVWDELREKEFPNRVFDQLSAVIHQLESGLPRLCGNQEGLRSLTAWPWIVNLNLTAN